MLEHLQTGYVTADSLPAGMTTAERSDLKDFVADSQSAGLCSYSDRGMEYIFAPGACPRKRYWYNTTKAGHGSNVGASCPANIYNEEIPAAEEET